MMHRHIGAITAKVSPCRKSIALIYTRKQAEKWLAQEWGAGAQIRIDVATRRALEWFLAQDHEVKKDGVC